MSEATSVGQIGLDLVVNKKDFNKQMSGIQSLATKVGKKLAAAFAVKKLVDFSEKCIELGSDLSEVQNVVDVTFPAMSKQVDKFAHNAATAFGLSETMAKRYTGTFGAMAKAFGFSEKQAYDMSTTLTGLFTVAKQLADVILGLSVLLQIRILHKSMGPADELHQILVVLLTVFSYQCHKFLLFTKFSRNYSAPHSQNRISDAFLNNKFTCCLLI